MGVREAIGGVPQAGPPPSRRRSGRRFWGNKGPRAALLLPLALLLAIPAIVLPLKIHAAGVDPSHVSFTLEGCRASASVYPATGPFVCPDANYTTGNLGSGWNELDLVPHRLTAAAGNAAPDTQTYTIAIAADNCIKSGTVTGFKCADGSNGYPGYDVISDPVLNTHLSDSSCTALTDDPSGGAGNVLVPGVGGTDVSLDRKLTITQLGNTTCVYDYYERLALGSHLFPGASLHSDLLNQDLGTSGIGARDVSIPVNGIAPQALSKTMSAVQGTDHVWNLTKSSAPASLSFSNTCDTGQPTSQGVDITVTWTKLAATPSGDITVVTNITATNPSHRNITTNITDTVYSGTTAVTATSGTNPWSTSIVVAPGSQTVTHTITVAAGTTSLNDIATATYVDTVTTIPIPGQTQATASATVQSSGSSQNQSATITDVESLSGDSDIDFSVATPTVGSFTGGYTGTKTRGPVNWSSGSQSSSGSVIFHKTVYAEQPTSGTATLTDSALLAGSNGFATSYGPLNVSITAGAAVALTVNKTIPGGVTGTQSFDFQLFSGGLPIASTATPLTTQTISIPSGTTGHTTFTNLTPGIYSVHEALPAGSPWTQQPDQSATITLPTCSGSVSVTNSFSPASATVQKITVPSGHESGWTFTLTGPGTGTSGESVTTTGATAIPFTTALQQGAYTVTETGQPGWDQTSPANTQPCTFTVVYPNDAGRVFACVFTNTERSAVQVIKTESGLALTGSESFQFELKGPNGYDVTQTADATNGGTLTWGLVGGVPQLVHGSYTLCELNVLAGWSSTLANVPGATTNPNTGDICAAFTLNAGVFNPPFTFTIDNTPPPGGGQRTIGFWKNWSCQAPGHQTDQLTQWLPLQMGSYQVTNCAEAVNILANPSGKYAENQLAAQLLAAELNVKAGASTCASVTTAINQANALLTTIGYNPANAPTQLIDAKSQYRASATSLATILNNYNNGLVC